MIITKWITVNDIGTSESGKTIIWNVSSIRGVFLGQIKWWATWRKYAFFPLDDTVFEEDCLRDIANWCEQATRRHKQK